MKLKELVPLKAVVEDLCVSKSTLWRARNSDLPGFPKATIIRRQVFWKESELGALEDALILFKGRAVFDEQRANTKRVDAIMKRKGAAKRKRRQSLRRDTAQQELF